MSFLRKAILILCSLFCLQKLYAQSSFDLQGKPENKVFRDSRHFLADEDSAFAPSLIDLIGKKSKISIHPLFELMYASDNQSGNIQRYGIGGQLKWSTPKVNLGLSYLYNSGEYMSYRQDLINSRSVIPAFGFKSGLSSIESRFYDAYFNYRPNQIFSFELGYGRKFIGEGHRSLLLSDLSAPAPYLQIQTSFWKLTYTNLFSSQLNTFGVVGNDEFYQRKFTATHFLNLKLFERLNLGVFESVIWQADEGSFFRGIDPNYLNPVIFYRPVEFSIGSSDNVIIGANFSYRVFKSHTFYIQAMIDEFLLAEIRKDVRQELNEEEDTESGWWGNKYGLQAGWKARSLFGLKGLFGRLEYNLVRPYTYAHSNPSQAYTHNSLPLAHPLGANFEEGIAQLSLQKKKWRWSAQYNQSRRGSSLPGLNFGEEPELSNVDRIKEYENFIAQGLLNQSKYFEAFVARKMPFLWGAELSLGYVWRQNESNINVDVNSMLFLSIRSNVLRQTFDY